MSLINYYGGGGGGGGGMMVNSKICDVVSKWWGQLWWHHKVRTDIKYTATTTTTLSPVLCILTTIFTTIQPEHKIQSGKDNENNSMERVHSNISDTSDEIHEYIVGTESLLCDFEVKVMVEKCCESCQLRKLFKWSSLISKTNINITWPNNRWMHWKVTKSFVYIWLHVKSIYRSWWFMA